MSDGQIAIAIFLVANSALGVAAFAKLKAEVHQVRTNLQAVKHHTRNAVKQINKLRRRSAAAAAALKA
jgi:hypothetical protein